MTKKQAQHFARGLAECSDRVFRDYLSTLRGIPDDKRAEIEKFLQETKLRDIESTTRFFRSLPSVEPARERTRSRAERLKRESEARQKFLRFARGIIRKPAAGGRPPKTTAAQRAAILARVSYLLGEGSDKQTAFEEAGKPYDVSRSTVRRMWVEYRKARQQKTRSRAADKGIHR